ncbi:hypothetical protein PG990_002362 [Apiospora arundinis]
MTPPGANRADHRYWTPTTGSMDDISAIDWAMKQVPTPTQGGRDGRGGQGGAAPEPNERRAGRAQRWANMLAGRHPADNGGNGNSNGGSTDGSSNGSTGGSTGGSSSSSSSSNSSAANASWVIQTQPGGITRVAGHVDDALDDIIDEGEAAATPRPLRHHRQIRRGWWGGRR